MPSASGGGSAGGALATFRDYGAGFRNRLINGDMSIAQRGTTFDAATTFLNSDDLYTLDRWYLLTDGNDIVDVTQNQAAAPTNRLNCIRLDVETANKKFGIAQIIEQKNCVGLIGGPVTLSFKAKVSATTNLDNLKAAIVAWDGTADTVTSDIISAWGVEGTNPTLIANATYENTPANLNPSTSWQTFTITANVDTASAKNIIVFIWSDVTDTTVGDFLYITDVQLESGETATPYDDIPAIEQLQRCARYLPCYDSSLTYGASNFVGWGQNFSTTQGVATVPFLAPVRTAPTGATVSLASHFGVYKADGSVAACTALAFNSSSLTGGTLVTTVASGLTAGNSAMLLQNGSTSGRIWFTGCEL